MPIKITTSSIKITEENDRNAAFTIDGIDSDSIIVTVSNSGSRRDGDTAAESMIMEWDDVRALIDELTALADEYAPENADDDSGASGADDDSYIQYAPETGGVPFPNDELRIVSSTTTTTTTTVRECPR
ncbi:MAG: hypothetical protein IPO08_18655 [Xanthomonadales bacterium]|nr:hypothetical protein [Xanthomonadales bacterium]